MYKDIRIYLKEIIECMNYAEEFLENTTFEEFINDRKTKDAVVRELEVIGEAVKNLPDDFRDKYPKVPWRKMAGLRDKLIHFYFGIDYEMVWKIVKEDIPETRLSIEKILSELEQTDK